MTVLTGKEEMENRPRLWTETQPKQVIPQYKKTRFLQVSPINPLKIKWNLTSSPIFVFHSKPWCCTSAEEYKRLCAFFSLHAGSNSQTWLPGILRLLEGSEPETKPLAPILLGLEHSASVLSMGGVSSLLRRGSHGLHSLRSPLTQSSPLQHTGKKHTTLPRHNTQCFTTAELSNYAVLTLRFDIASLAACEGQS